MNCISLQDPVKGDASHVFVEKYIADQSFSSWAVFRPQYMIGSGNNKDCEEWFFDRKGTTSLLIFNPAFQFSLFLVGTHLLSLHNIFQFLHGWLYLHECILNSLLLLRKIGPEKLQWYLYTKSYNKVFTKLRNNYRTRYIALRYRIQTQGNSRQLTAYSDAGWAGCSNTCKSLNWLVHVPWRCTNLSVRSKIEYLDLLLNTNLSPLHRVNTSAIQIASHWVYHECSKHIQVDCHYIWVYNHGKFIFFSCQNWSLDGRYFH